MRTTLEISDDVLSAARELARRQQTTIGSVISDLARQALTGSSGQSSSVREPRAVYGFRPFASKGKVVTNEVIDDLRDREGV